ncbi:helix-turn-helix domain-containing protein [Rhodococcus aerolatus]
MSVDEGVVPGPADRDPRACDGALERAFGFLGKRWNGVLLATLLAGPLGFADLRRAVAGISDSVLSERLSELGRAGLVVRRVDPGPPVAVAYSLTGAGHALLPSIEALTAWSRAHLPEQGCPAPA